MKALEMCKKKLKTFLLVNMCTSSQVKSSGKNVLIHLSGNICISVLTSFLKQTIFLADWTNPLAKRSCIKSISAHTCFLKQTF